MKILVIEDDELTAKALTTILSGQQYAVEVASDGQAGLELVEAFTYDLVLLDVSLPKLDGISLCQQLRSQGYQMPILLLTAHDSSHDKAIGLDAGADDYVVKPFNAEELVARIRALLRRSGLTSQPVLEWDCLRLDPSSCEVTYAGQPVPLTPKEYALLELFLRNRQRVFSCDVILEHLWTFEETPGEEAVRTHIKGLRQKLKAVGAPADVVETVYGIGYRLKPLQAEHPAAKLSKRDDTNQLTEETSVQQQTLAAIADIWSRFQPRVQEQLDLLKQAAQALLDRTLTPDLRQQAEQEAHTLAGSLGTFGFAEGSELARKIETLLRSEKALSRQKITDLNQSVTTLQQIIGQNHDPMSTKLQETSAALLDDRPLVLVIAADRQLSEPLLREAASWDLRVEIAAELSTARVCLEHNHPNLVLLDLAIAPTKAESLALLAELNQKLPPIPVLVLAAENQLHDRLTVARLGGQAFLKKPLSAEQVLVEVNRILQHVKTTEARVMIVDDDPQILATLKTLLLPWGLKVTTLDDSTRFWEVLEAASPNLLILDIKMPQISGVELCRVVRNDPRWSELPILFLTAYIDAATVNQVFAAGADDFISKPIVGPELVTRIMNRLERTKLLRNLAELDSLTKVLNRQKSRQALDELLHRAEQHQQPLSLAVLNLNHLKQINHRYGDAVGDKVLRQLGQVLRRSFRGDDAVGRWSGEEFVIGMYGMTKQDAEQRLTHLLEFLQQESFPGSNSVSNSASAQMTLSAGIAQYPDDGTNLQLLYAAADSALSQAKTAGENWIILVKNANPEIIS